MGPEPHGRRPEPPDHEAGDGSTRERSGRRGRPTVRSTLKGSESAREDVLAGAPRGRPRRRTERRTPWRDREPDRPVPRRPEDSGAHATPREAIGRARRCAGRRTGGAGTSEGEDAPPTARVDRRWNGPRRPEPLRRGKPQTSNGEDELESPSGRAPGIRRGRRNAEGGGTAKAGATTRGARPEGDAEAHEGNGPRAWSNTPTRAPRADARSKALKAGTTAPPVAFRHHATPGERDNATRATAGESRHGCAAGPNP